MKTLFSTICICLMLISCNFIQNAMANQGVLVFDQKDVTTTPIRVMKALHISGSPQFSEQSLIKMLPQMQGEVWIVDLRRESHGFVDGLPVSWYFIQNKSNVGLSLDEILIKEEELLSNLCLKPSLVIEKISQKGEGKIILNRLSQWCTFFMGHNQQAIHCRFVFQ